MLELYFVEIESVLIQISILAITISCQPNVHLYLICGSFYMLSGFLSVGCVVANTLTIHLCW
jgi:hypothetical protein